MRRPDAQHRELLRVLTSHKVDFVLVGGVAPQVHGFSGATRDVDATVGVDAPDGERISAAPQQVGAAPHLVGERGSAYRTDLGQIEIMRSTDGVGDYQAWLQHASSIELEPGLIVRVGSASDLLASKEAAAREKDLRVLPLIRAELLRAGALSQADIRGPVAALPSEAPPDPRANELLGPRPGERRARGLWDHGADLIAGYRERWQIPIDTSDPLDDVPSTAAQRRPRLTRPSAGPRRPPALTRSPTARGRRRPRSGPHDRRQLPHAAGQRPSGPALCSRPRARAVKP